MFFVDRKAWQNWRMRRDGRHCWRVNSIRFSTRTISSSCSLNARPQPSVLTSAGRKRFLRLTSWPLSRVPEYSRRQMNIRRSFSSRLQPSPRPALRATRFPEHLPWPASLRGSSVAPCLLLTCSSAPAPIPACRWLASRATDRPREPALARAQARACPLPKRRPWPRRRRLHRCLCWQRQRHLVARPRVKTVAR